MTTTTNFLITFVVKPNRAADFVDLLATLKTDLPKVDGCQSLRIFQQDDATQNTFTLLETWDHKSMHQDHVARLQSSGDWAAIEAMLSAPPNGYYLRSI